MNTLSYLDRVVLRVVADVYQRTHAPVRTIAVSAHLGKGDRNCRRYLASLEQRGLVMRVGRAHPKSGWLPVVQIEPERVAAEYVLLRQYASALEARLEAAGLTVPARRAGGDPRLALEVEALFQQPPLPGFGALAPVVYLN